MKERVTLTIESSLLKDIDARIDGLKIKNRSHATELLLRKALGNQHPKLALILAGGIGTRLKPITDEIPKPMMPVHGKPILQHNVELLRKHGISKILIAIGYKGEKIKEYFGDGKRFGVDITYLEEEKPLGTAGCLRLAEPYLKESFVMCNGDELKELDLDDMYLLHKESKAIATIALTTVEDPSAYGVVDMKGNKILRFVEKPKKEEAPSNLINSGLYILEPDIIKFLPEEQENVSIERDVFPKVAQAERLLGYPFSGQWFSTDTLERYERAIKNWKDIE